MRQINNREEFHSVRAEYLKHRERDARHIASGRRGWTPAAKAMCSAMDALARYAVNVTKRGHSATVCCKALNDAALCRRYAEFLSIEKDLRDQWIDALAYNSKFHTEEN